MKYYKKTETVVEVLGGSPEFKYIFGVNGREAIGRVESAIKGTSSPLIKAHVGTDRYSKYGYINASRIEAIKVSLVEVPLEIINLIDSLKDLEEDSVEASDVMEQLNNYFNLD